MVQTSKVNYLDSEARVWFLSNHCHDQWLPAAGPNLLFWARSFQSQCQTAYEKAWSALRSYGRSTSGMKYMFGFTNLFLFIYLSFSCLQYSLDMCVLPLGFLWLFNSDLLFSLKLCYNDKRLFILCPMAICCVEGSFDLFFIFPIIWCHAYVARTSLLTAISLQF